MKELKKLYDEGIGFLNFAEDEDLEKASSDVLDWIDECDFNYGEFMEGWKLMYNEAHEPYVEIKGKIYGKKGSKIITPISGKLLREWINKMLDFLRPMLEQ